MTVRELIRLLEAIPDEDKELTVLRSDSEWGPEELDTVEVEVDGFGKNKRRVLVLT